MIEGHRSNGLWGEDTAVKLLKLPWPLRVLLGLAAAYGITFVIGIISTWWHYNTADDFDTFLSKTHVTSAVLDSRMLEGTPLDGSQGWSLGPSPPNQLPPGALHESWGKQLTLIAKHGDEELLHLNAEFFATVDPATATHWGAFASVPVVRTRPGMRAVVLVGLLGVEEMVGADSEGKGAAVIDVVLLAGEGESEVRFVELSEEPKHFDPQLASLFFPMVRALFGFAYPAGGLPDEGYIYHSRSFLRLNWEVREPGTLVTPMQMPSNYRNCTDYSFAMEATIRSIEKGEERSSCSMTFSQTFDLNGETW